MRRASRGPVGALAVIAALLPALLVIRQGPLAGVDAQQAGQVSGGPAAQHASDLSDERAAALHARQFPRRLILKLREEADHCLPCEVARGPGGSSVVPGSRLAELHRRFGVRRARPLVRAHARGERPEPPAAAARRRAAVAARFPERSRRAPHGARAPRFDRTYVLELRRRPDMDRVARAYAADPAVEYCEPDHVVRIESLTDDPFLGTSGSWGQDFDDLWGVKRIGAPQAWDTARGAGILVAVVDTGVDYNHPDIASNIWTHPTEIPSNGIDDDGNGFVDDVRGWDFADGDDDPMDYYGHGTHVAGTVAAVGDNGTGVVGVAYESRVMAVKAFPDSGYAEISDLTEAILYAVDNGADVINASWGLSSFSQTLSDAVADAYASGVAFVAAAGNAGRDVATHFPSADRRSIAVAALDHTDARAWFSNFGLGIDVGAPGGGDDPPPRQSHKPSSSILSLLSGAGSNFSPVLELSLDGTEYVRLSGTSMAAPHVAGAVALLLSRDPFLSIEEARQVLRTTAVDLGAPGPDEEFGYGRLDAARAILAPRPLSARILEPRSGTFVGEVSLEIRGTATGPDFTGYTLDFRSLEDPNGWTRIAGPVGTPVEEGVLADWEVGSVPDGDYVLRLTAERTGEAFTDLVTVTLDNVVITSPRVAWAYRAQDPLEVVGTAAGGGFLDYTIEYRRPAVDPGWFTDRLTRSVPPGTPVRNGVLATFDASDLTEGDRFDFRLTVETASGPYVQHRSSVLDPTLRPGWPQLIVEVGDSEYLTVADLDEDGIQEILVGSGDEVVVFEPDGTVRPGWPQSVATADFPLVTTRGSPIVADVDGDGRPEVIATNRREILAWSADGTLEPGFPVTVDVFQRGANHWISAADLDGDGTDDIVCSGLFGIQFFRGDGTEIFDSRMDDRYALGPAMVADIDGDGASEVGLVEAKAGYRLWGYDFRGKLRLLDPGGELIAERGAKAKFFPHPGLADLDGDGVLDLYVLHENKRKTRVRGYSLKRAGDRVTIRAPRVAPRWEMGRGSGQMSFADLDADGVAEGYTYQRSHPGGTFEDDIGYFMRFRDRRAGPPLPPLVHRLFRISDDGGHRGRGIAIADVDGDGVQELIGGVAGHGCGISTDYCEGGTTPPRIRRGVVVQRLDGTLLEKFPKPLPHPHGELGGGAWIGFSVTLDDPRAATPAVADLDGDGLKEIIFVDESLRGIKVYVWNVEGTPGPLLAHWPMYQHDPKHSNVFPVSQP